MIAVVLATLLLPSPNPTLPIEVVDAPRAHLRLEVAQTEEQRERGLMSRASLVPHTGMLFVFQNDEQISFWMKDTLISLDMIFIANDGTVRKIFAHVPTVAVGTPDDEIPLETAQARYVIELAAGEAALDGIAPGVRLHVAGTP